MTNHHPHLMRLAAATAALAAAGVLAQPARAPAAPDVGVPPVVTDVGPPPAQDRGSVGAVVLEQSPVRAHREEFGRQKSGPERVKQVGRDVLRATFRARTAEELASERELEALELYQRGAGSQTPK